MSEALAMRSWTVPLRWLQLGSIIAPLALAAAAGGWLWRAEYRHAEEMVTRSALLVAQYALRMLSSQEQLLRHADGLAAQLGPDPDLARLRLHLADLVAADPYSRGLALVDADGELVASHATSIPDARLADRSYYRRLRDERWPLLVDRIFLRPDGEDALVIAMPRVGLDFGGAVVSAVEVGVLAEFLRTITGPNGAAASLLRQDGMLLIRHSQMEAPIQLTADMPVMQVVAGQGGPLYEATAVTDGVTRLYATLQLADLPYYASFGIPVTAVRDAWLRSMLPIVAGLAAITAIALLVVRELNRRVQAQLDAETLMQTRMAAEHREMLFRELNHRVKNNLQLVESLLRLRGRGRSEEIREILGEVAVRVGAIGALHAELSDCSNELMVDLGELLERLTDNPALVPPERGVTLRCRAAGLAVPVDQAIAVALIAVEAVTNAIKHAFPEGRGGHVEVALEEAAGMVRLSVKDNGVGHASAEAASESSGLQLIEALARKVSGSVQLSVAGGTEVVVTFPSQPAAGSTSGPDVAAAA